jgi:hypothetical protein
MSHKSYDEILEQHKKRGEIEPHSDFDYETVFANTDGPEPPQNKLSAETVRVALELFNRVIIWCFDVRFPGDSPTSGRSMELAHRRFVVMTYLLNPRVLNVKALTELCKATHSSKATLSATAVNFRDTFGIEVMSGRTAVARKRMAELARGNTNAKGKRMPRRERK